MTEPLTPAAAGGLAGLDLEYLPSGIAAPLAEYVAEIDPLLRLWHICDAVESALRLLVVVGFGDTLQSHQRALPAELLFREDLGSHVAEPVLSRWYRMARVVAQHMPNPATVAPEIHGFLTRAVEPLLEGSAGTAEDSILELRQYLGRGGGITRAEAARLLALHAPRFEESMRVGALWLGDLEFVVPGNGGRPAGVLAGTATPGLRAFRPASSTVARKVEASARAGDAVVLVRGEAVIPLWPLVFQDAGRQEQRLLLTALASIEVVQNAPEEATVDGFLRLFEQATSGRGDSIGSSVETETTPKQTAILRKPPALAGKGGPPEAVRLRLPDERRSITHKFHVGEHEGYLTVGMYQDGRPGEIFIVMAKEGHTLSGMTDGFATAISLALQHGVPLNLLVNKFAHTRFEPSGFSQHPEIGYAKSIMDYIFRWLDLKFPDGRFVEASPDHVPIVAETNRPVCQECGWNMVYAGGPYKCLNCGATMGDFR